LILSGPSWDQDRALMKCPVGISSEGASQQGRLDPRQKCKKAAEWLPVRGPSWDRTSDTLIMSNIFTVVIICQN